MVNLYKVAIVGRVNVGKSTLFNKLIAEKKAIISSRAGTTRDRNYAVCSWRDIDFYLIDTGGLEDDEVSKMNEDISEQALIAAEEANLILFVVDSKNGIMPQDMAIAKKLKKQNKNIVLVANKSDNDRLRSSIAEFYKLALGEPWPVSSTSGTGTGDLLDKVVSTLKKIPKSQLRKVVSEKDIGIKVAIVGKPNVGKSSIINAMLGEKRLIVSSKPHTTRDSQDIDLVFEKQKITLIDTAGIRRHTNKSSNKFEKESVAQSIKSIQKADITILVTDVSKKLTWQDKKLINEAADAKTGIIMLANKWDLIENKDTDTISEFIKYYQRFFPFITWAPLIFTSAKEKLRLKRILTAIVKANAEKNRVIAENTLSKLLKTIVKRHKPSRGKGTNHPYIYTLKQLSTNPPKFAIKINFKADLHDSYLRFIENNLRFKFGFVGTPIKIIVHKSQNTKDID